MCRVMVFQFIKYISFFSLACLGAASFPQSANEAYLQVSSKKPQLPSLAAGSLIEFEHIEDQKNFEVSPSNNTFICKVPGVYMMACGFQSGTLNPKVSGYLDVWYIINGVPLVASTSRQYASSSLPTVPVVGLFLMELKENDHLSVGFIASGPDLGLIYIKPDNPNDPEIVSAGFTLYKL